MKQLREIAVKPKRFTRSELHGMERAAHYQYQGVSADLLQAVPEGRGHTAAAADHLADFLHDKYHASHGHSAHYRRIANKVAKSYGDDRKETTAHFAKERRARKRAEAARNRPPKPPREKKKKQSWWQEIGLSMKPRRGIGSY